MTETEAAARPRPRIESLSDLIFGLALSVGAITLVGNINAITTMSQLINDIAVFGFSFLILITVWMRYTKIMSVLPLENNLAVSLNTALLFAVSVEPFLFNVLELNTVLSKDAASQAYAVDLGIVMLLLGGFSLVLTDEEKKLVPKDMIREFKTEGITMFVAGATFLVSDLPIFWTPGPFELHLRFYLWIIPFVLSAVRRRTLFIISGVRKSRNGKQ